MLGNMGHKFLWLVLQSLFAFIYRPSRQGRKVAYLTLASFGFGFLVLAAGHGDACRKQNTAAGKRGIRDWGLGISESGGDCRRYEI